MAFVAGTPAALHHLLRQRAGDLGDAPDVVCRPAGHDEVAAVQLFHVRDRARGKLNRHPGLVANAAVAAPVEQAADAGEDHPDEQRERRGVPRRGRRRGPRPAW